MTCLYNEFTALLKLFVTRTMLLDSTTSLRLYYKLPAKCRPISSASCNKWTILS